MSRSRTPIACATLAGLGLLVSGQAAGQSAPSPPAPPACGSPSAQLAPVCGLVCDEAGDRLPGLCPRPAPPPPPPAPPPEPRPEGSPPAPADPSPSPEPESPPVDRGGEATREAAPAPALAIVSFAVPRTARGLRSGLRLRLAAGRGRLEDVEARLISRDGRMVARGTLPALEERALVRLQLRGRLRPGRYRLKAAGYDAAGSTVSVARAVRVRRRR